MLNVYLTDLDQTVSLELGHGVKDIAQVMALKKIFLSIPALLEPVIPDNQDLRHMSWRATQAEFTVFKRLALDWQQLELRLKGYAVFAGREAMDIIVQVGQQQRQARLAEAGRFKANLLEMDVFMLHVIHRQLDQLLAREQPYARQFLKQWPKFELSLAS